MTTTRELERIKGLLDGKPATSIIDDIEIAVSLCISNAVWTPLQEGAVLPIFSDSLIASMLEAMSNLQSTSELFRAREKLKAAFLRRLLYSGTDIRSALCQFNGELVDSIRRAWMQGDCISYENRLPSAPLISSCAEWHLRDLINLLRGACEGSDDAGKGKKHQCLFEHIHDRVSTLVPRITNSPPGSTVQLAAHTQLSRLLQWFDSAIRSSVEEESILMWLTGFQFATFKILAKHKIDIVPAQPSQTYVRYLRGLPNKCSVQPQVHIPHKLFWNNCPHHLDLELYQAKSHAALVSDRTVWQFLESCYGAHILLSCKLCHDQRPRERFDFKLHMLQAHGHDFSDLETPGHLWFSDWSLSPLKEQMKPEKHITKYLAQRYNAIVQYTCSDGECEYSKISNAVSDLGAFGWHEHTAQRVRPVDGMPIDYLTWETPSYGKLAVSDSDICSGLLA